MFESFYFKIKKKAKKINKKKKKKKWKKSPNVTVRWGGQEL